MLDLYAAGPTEACFRSCANANRSVKLVHAMKQRVRFVAVSLYRWTSATGRSPLL